MITGQFQSHKLYLIQIHTVHALLLLSAGLLAPGSAAAAVEAFSLSLPLPLPLFLPLSLGLS
eukprot:m.211464 g.211464  ORF g.211464 m.211464 type:complete len:62 (-) comp17149_c0_seq2:2139-2324(-)